MKTLKTTLKIFLIIMLTILVFTESISILYPVYILGLLLLTVFGLLEWAIDNILGNYHIVELLSGDFPGIEPNGLVAWAALVVFYFIVSYLIALMIKKIRRKKDKYLQK